MIGHYVELAWRSLRRHRVLSAVMVAVFALGIGASCTMLTVLHNLAGDPLPSRSSVLYHPQVDPLPLHTPSPSPEPPDGLTYIDALNLYRVSGATHKVMMGNNWLPTRTADAGSPLGMQNARGTTSDFFSMFDVHFIYGTGWSAQDDDARTQVVVISRALNQKLFGGANSVGRELIIATKSFRIVGVISDWNPKPRFFDVLDGAYASADNLFLPFLTWMNLPQDYGYGPMECWGTNPGAGQHDPKAPNCAWVQFWVQLDSAPQRYAYQQVLRQYSAQQKQLGRFEREPNVRLRLLLDWLDCKHVIPLAVRMQSWISFGVLFICVVNLVGLLVAKFMRKSGEIGLRRALGASKRQIFGQCLIEAGLLGLMGGACALPLVWAGVWMARQQPSGYASSIHVSGDVLAIALLVSLLAALCAGVWPAWRAAGIAPGLQVKSL